tara:strand:+ start:1867 stop:2445 length:579 start_codon:yes stop_codon:yes gene_type:complete
MNLVRLFLFIFLFLFNFLVFAETPIDNTKIVKSSILVLSQDDLFKKSAPGKALLKVFEEKQAKLLAEASRIEKQFIAEEKALTEQRSELDISEFQNLADAFDDKVEKVRTSRAQKDKKLQKDFAIWRKKFVQIVLPIVREQMSQFNALVVLDTTNRGLIYDKKVDVTDVIIDRLNEEFLNNPLILDQVIEGN